MRKLHIKTLATATGGDYGDVMYLVVDDSSGGGGGPCNIRDCQTTCTGPMGVECCCFYDCPSGGQWVCQQGQYCSNAGGGCL